MDERDRDRGPDREDVAPAPADRRAYTPPTLIEYGSVSKLTQAGGNTILEGKTKKGKGCL